MPRAAQRLIRFPQQQASKLQVLERICIPPTEPAGTQFDLGLIGEALLFYGETFLVVAGNSLPELVRQIGPDVLFRLIDEHQLKLRFIDHNLGAITTNKGTHFARYDVGLIHAEKHSFRKGSVPFVTQAKEVRLAPLIL